MPDNYYSKELEAPFQAPRWTLSGYQGSLKAAVQNACGEIPSDTINVSGTRTSDVRSSQTYTHTPDEQQLLQQIRSPAAPAAPADDADDADEQRLLQLIRSSQNSANTPAASDEPPTSSTQTTSRTSTQTSSELPDLIPPFRTESRSLSGSKKKKKKSKRDN